MNLKYFNVCFNYSSNDNHLCRAVTCCGNSVCACRPCSFSDTQIKVLYASMFQQVLKSASSNGPLVGAMFWNAITYSAQMSSIYDTAYNVYIDEQIQYGGNSGRKLLENGTNVHPEEGRQREPYHQGSGGSSPSSKRFTRQPQDKELYPQQRTSPSATVAKRHIRPHRSLTLAPPADDYLDAFRRGPAREVCAVASADYWRHAPVPDVVNTRKLREEVQGKTLTAVVKDYASRIAAA